MGIVSKYNTSNPFSGIDTKTFEYVGLDKLADSYDKDHVYKVAGLFINPKGKYGSEPVAILGDCLVNLPRHLLDTVNEMLDDDATIQAFKNGKVGFKIYSYKNKFVDPKDPKKKLFYGVTWIDL